MKKCTPVGRASFLSVRHTPWVNSCSEASKRCRFSPQNTQLAAGLGLFVLALEPFDVTGVPKRDAGHPRNLDYQPQNGAGTLASGSYFGVLGLRPALGRLLTPEDDRTPGESAAGSAGGIF